MLMRRSLLAFVLMLGLMAGTLATALAGGTTAPTGLSAAQQDDATPEADGDSTSGRDSTVEDVPVDVLDESGDPSLTITLSNFNDDWQDYEDYSAPDRGFHYVYFEITVENIGNRAADVASYDFFVRDSEGFLYGKVYLSVLEDSPTAELDEFDPSDAIQSGDTYSGYLVVMVPDNTELVDVFYAPSGRLITLAELGADAISDDN